MHRKTFQGTGTHAAAERAARMLASRDIAMSALAVCNPAYPPKEITSSSSRTAELPITTS